MENETYFKKIIKKHFTLFLLFIGIGTVLLFFTSLFLTASAQTLGKVTVYIIPGYFRGPSFDGGPVCTAPDKNGNFDTYDKACKGAFGAASVFDHLGTAYISSTEWICGTNVSNSYQPVFCSVPPPFCSISIDKPSIVVGDTAVLNWSTANLSSALINQNGSLFYAIPAVNLASGNKQVSPPLATGSYTYAIIATDLLGNSLTCSPANVNLDVNSPPPPSAIPTAFSSIGLTSRPLKDIINSITVWLLDIAAAIAILFIVIGSLYYVTAAGDERHMETAKQTITYAIWGIFVVGIAYAIVVVVNQIIGS